MKCALIAACAAMALMAGAAHADPLTEAKAGLTALDKGDNPEAARLFTVALDSGRLTRSDQELAFVKRSEAFLAMGQPAKALQDANQALDLEPGDREASNVADRAKALLAPKPQVVVAKPAPPSHAAEAYAAALRNYDAEKRANSEQYAQALAAHDADVKAAQARHEADLAAWQTNVKACEAGDLSKCAHQPGHVAVADQSASTGPLTPAEVVAGHKLP